MFRQIPYTVLPFDDLGLPEAVRHFSELPRDLVLVTGPTGSGKSTTLASINDLVNQHRPCHIITIEEPIEFVHDSKMALVSQRRRHRHRVVRDRAAPCSRPAARSA